VTSPFVLRTAGERVRVQADARFRPMIDECGVLSRPTGDFDLSVKVENERRAFDVTGWETAGRDIWTRGDETVVRNVCSSGFDMLLQNAETQPGFTFRWRPQRRERVAYTLLRSRARLRFRAVLIQFPAMWRAVLRGRAPLHAPACTAGPRTVLLTGASGVGKSTLIAHEVEAGGHAVSDNIVVTDGRTVWGLVEPVRSEDGSGRRMPHGRRETELRGRVPELQPDHLVLLRRSHRSSGDVRRCEPETAARVLIASTYMAGELRRFWSFVATLAAATQLGPPHPPVTSLARDLAHSLVCVDATLPADRVGIQELLGTRELATA
jgi:hypothetical protein